MRLISARQAWHDCYYTPWDSVMHHGLEGAKLGKRGYVPNETRPDRWENLGRCAHMAVAGRVQNAIASLPLEYQAFGHHLYAPVITTEQSNAWDDAAHGLLAGGVDLALRERGEKRRCLDYSREYYVARGVLVRYRHMVQGGMGANPDPMANSWVFRGWLADHHGVILDRRNWTRDWGWLIQLVFEIAGTMDRKCLAPVGKLLGEQMEAA